MMQIEEVKRVGELTLEMRELASHVLEDQRKKNGHLTVFDLPSDDALVIRLAQATIEYFVVLENMTGCHPEMKAGTAAEAIERLLPLADQLDAAHRDGKL
jgi:hypothetical protein